MMRIALPMRRTVFFLAMLAIALIVLLPLRLALGWLSLDTLGFAAREARGSVWFGQLAETRFAGTPLGDLDARLDVLPLLAGRARVDLARRGDGGDAFRGAVSVTRRTVGADDVTARVMPGQTFAPLPLTALDLADLSVRFRDGLCEQADGLVRATLGSGFGGVDLSSGLTGTARCDGGALLLPLASRSGQERFTLSLRQGGNYRAALRIQPADAAAQESLAAAGFSPGAEGYALMIEGRL